MGTTRGMPLNQHAIKVAYDGATLHLYLDEDATIRDVRAALKERKDVNLPKDWQLIANGTDQGDAVVLRSLGEFYFMKNVLFLRALDAEACLDWQRTGRCKQGSKCPFHKTHSMKYSPRYVAHTSPQTSPREDYTPPYTPPQTPPQLLTPPQSPPRSPPRSPLEGPQEPLVPTQQQ